MSDASASEGRPTAVTIFGRTYHLRGDGDAAYLEELAREVDRRMREVGDATGTADSLKIAILAALNITDDWFRTSRNSSPEHREDDERLVRLIATLDEVLAE
jgi:cell division protein ZapA (FtsZ GTPase activity inhibitor)